QPSLQPACRKRADPLIGVQDVRQLADFALIPPPIGLTDRDELVLDGAAVHCHGSSGETVVRGASPLRWSRTTCFRNGQSSRRAFIGSPRVARNAGGRAAARAAAARTAGTAAKTAGSVASTWKRSASSTRLKARAPSVPTAIPTATGA